MSRIPRIISVDDHVVEPPDLWTDRAALRRAFSDWRLNWPVDHRYEYHATSMHWVLSEIIERRTGTRLADLAADHAGTRITFADTQYRPQPVVTSPEWSGSEHGGRRYSAFVVNVERLKPWHTLTGRQHFFLDHDWMREIGENLPIFRPPLDLHRLYGDAVPAEEARAGRELPIGLASAATLIRDVPQGAVVTYDDVTLDETRTIVVLRKLQDLLLAGGLFPADELAALIRQS